MREVQRRPSSALVPGKGVSNQPGITQNNRLDAAQRQTVNCAVLAREAGEGLVRPLRVDEGQVADQWDTPGAGWASLGPQKDPKEAENADEKEQPHCASTGKMGVTKAAKCLAHKILHLFFVWPLNLKVY